jgi:SAM-dependent methyltransferase
MRLTLERQFSPLLDKSAKFLLKRMIASYEPYHPVFIGDRQIAAGERSCLDRWTRIEALLRDAGVRSVLDLGCAEGYFIQRSARDLGCLALGVDADRRRLTVARMATNINEIERAGYIYGKISPDFVKTLPPFDGVIFLSVLHHVMYEHGVDYARQLMSAIRAITRKCLIFDMGQSNETQHEWAKLLPQMTPDPATWIAGFLKTAGFATVESIGQTDAYKSEARRELFIARP